MRRFVYCSSSLAVCWPMPNVKFDITDKTYNESAVQLAWAPPPYTPERSGAVYGASKVQGEQALYKYAAENNLPFVVNSVVPNANLGPLLAPDKQTTLSAQWIIDLFEKGTPPQIPKGHVLPPRKLRPLRRSKIQPANSFRRALRRRSRYCSSPCSRAH